MAVTDKPLDGVIPGATGRAEYVIPIGFNAATGQPSATSGITVKAASYTPAGDAQMTSAELASSSALESLPADATVAILQNNGTQAVRFRTNGVPTTTLGQRLLAGETLTLDIGQAGLATTRVIREADGAILDIEYYK